MAQSNGKPSGRLELTWANKRRRLIAREDGDYEWVPQGDYRAREVRLLREAGTVGEVADNPVDAAGDNLLIRGDSLHALNALTGIPAFAEQLVGKVKLIYIDPPFNTGEAFSQYDDGLEHSVWLTMMRDRLTQLKRLLAPDGSIWVHLDDNEMAYCRVLMDEVFGRNNFVASIIWEKADTLRNDARQFSIQHDTVLVFATDASTWASRRLERTAEMNSVYRNPDNDPRGPWLGAPLAKMAYRKNNDFPITTPSGRTLEPPDGGAWICPRATFDEWLAEGRIYFGKSGDGMPQKKHYLSEMGGRVPSSLWSVKEVGGNRQARAEAKALTEKGQTFATPKPERLMERIIHIATSPGDIVLDCFAGSGTTAAVAHKMGRRWVAVEWERETLETFIAPRLEKVVRGEDPGGITEAVGWEGGGGFRVLDVAPSMYEDDEGVIVLADWATDNALAEAVAAQLGFEYGPDGPYCGRQGRTRLAVLDGHLTKDAARMLLAGLGPNENLSVVAVGLDPDADALLRKERPGSRARVAPRDLLLTYAQPAAWQISAAPLVTPEMEEQLAELEQLDLLADGGAK